MIYYVGVPNPNNIEYLQRVGIEPISLPHLLRKELTIDDSLIITCEMMYWGEEQYIGVDKLLPGISLLQHLRREGYQGKVLLLSFLSRKRIDSISLSYIIHRTSKYGFLELPSTPEEWIIAIEHINPLSDVALEDIQTNFCNNYGLVIHELHAITSGGAENEALARKKVCNCIERVGNLFDLNVSAELDSAKVLPVAEAINTARLFCKGILAKNEADNIEDFKNGDCRPWSVLFLDDELTKDHRLIVELRRRVASVYCASSAEDAEEILRDNAKYDNRITLVLSDYRLESLDNGLKLHQEKQGYEFLVETAKRFPYMSLAALSDMPRKFLLRSLRKMGVKAEVYSKKDYLESDVAFNILIDHLLERGDEAYELILRAPLMSSTTWATFEPYYEKHRNSYNYGIHENYVSEKAKAYCDNYLISLDVIRKNSFSSPSSEAHNYLLGSDNAISTLQLEGEIISPFNLESYKSGLKRVNIENGETIKPSNFMKFLEKLVCRRVVLWYSRTRFDNPVVNAESCLPVLMGNEYLNTVSDESARGYVNTNLALKLREYPWTATIEERNWLAYTMRIGYDKTIGLEEFEIDVLNSCSKIIKRLPVIELVRPNTFGNCRIYLESAYLTIEKTQKYDQIDDLLNLLIAKLKSYKDEWVRLKSIAPVRVLRQAQEIRKRLIDLNICRSTLLDDPDLHENLLKKARKKLGEKHKEYFCIEGSCYMFVRQIAKEGTTRGKMKDLLTDLFAFHEESVRGTRALQLSGSMDDIDKLRDGGYFDLGDEEDAIRDD